MAVTTYVKNRRSPVPSRSYTQQPSASRRKGFSLSSSKLSSLKGVWKPRKREKMREKGEKGEAKQESWKLLPPLYLLISN